MAANTLTGLTQTLYQALDVVAAEKVGFIGAVGRDVAADMVALNQTVRSAVAPASSTVTISPGAYSPDSGAQTIGYKDVTITKNKMVPINWTGDEQLSLGSQYNTVIRDQFAQAFRAIRNEIEADIAAVAFANASRATGTYNTAPFSSANDLSDIANVQRILDDNGAADGDRSLVVSSAAHAKLRSQGVLFKVNEAGTEELLRDGVISRLEGMDIRPTRQAPSNTRGTADANYVIDGTGNTAAGSTVLKLKTGAGTILAGNVITVGGHSYVVKTALTSTLVEINAPGLVAAVTDGDAVTVAGTSGTATKACIGLHKSAIQLVMRQPMMPMGGDGASDVMVVQDPVSGLLFQIAMYKQYRQTHFEVGAAWGVGAIKPEMIAALFSA